MTAKELEEELVSLGKQKEQLVVQLHQVAGAERMVRHWLGKMQREEDATPAECKVCVAEES